MKHGIENFKELFDKISKKEWIRSINKGSSTVGLTFEKEINKPVESFEIPDYGCIEIKTHKINSTFPITLFHASPDGNSFFKIKYLQENYGHPDKNNPQYKRFCGDVNSIDKQYIGKNYKYQLYIDYTSRKIILNIFNRKNELIDNSCSWSFDLLEEKLKRKLKYLALIEAKSLYKNHTVYFKYQNLHLYQLKNFSYFIKAIEDGIISITFTISTFQHGKRIGQIHNHGTAFRIHSKHLKAIYDDIII